MGNINGFELPGGLLDRKGVDATQSVSTSIVRLDSISVPAGTFKSNDVFLMQSLITRAVTTTVGITHYIYWNTTDITSGAVLLAVSQGSTLDEYIPLYRTVCVVNSTTTLVYNTSLTNSTDLGDTLGADLGSAISTITSINWDTDGFLIVAALITSSTLTLTKRYFTVLR